MAQKKVALFGINKKPDFVGVATHAGVRAGSMIGLDIISGKVRKMITDKAKDPAKTGKILKMVGPVKVIAGIAMEAMMKKPILQDIGVGMYMSGTREGIGDLLPDTLKSKLGLSGLGQEEEENEGVGVDWDAIINESEKEAVMSGTRPAPKSFVHPDGEENDNLEGDNSADPELM